MVYIFGYHICIFVDYRSYKYINIQIGIHTVNTQNAIDRLDIIFTLKYIYL